MEDIDFKFTEEYDSEYALFYEKEETRRMLALQLIYDYDSMCYSIDAYLNYKKAGLNRIS